MNAPSSIPVRDGVDRAVFESEILTGGAPAVFRGLVADWPIVQAGRQSARALADFIKQLDGGRQAHVMEASADAGGRLFYRPDMSGFNFNRSTSSIGDAVERLLQLANASVAPTMFLEAMPAGAYLPRFAAGHRMPLLNAGVEPRVWIGNAAKINTHFDLVHNVACVAGGRRRFTLFPPEQIDNLYIAPLDFTPSGAPVSLVEFTQPDHERFPRYRNALPHALQAELEPGDALYIPFGWWHHVESLTPFNVLVNYWWNDAAYYGAPHGALLHSLLALRDLPPDQRAVWASIFQHLVFTDPERALAHLPPEKRGMLGPPSEERTRGIREKLAQDFNRPLGK